MEELKGRLTNFIEGYTKLSIRKFEEKCGLKNGTIGAIKTQGPTASNLYKISYTFPELNMNWLLTGKEGMLKDDKETADTSKKKELPLLPFDAVAGFLADNIPNSFAFSEETYSVPEFTARGADFAIRVCGDSMHPKYNNGDILAAKIVKDPSFFQWGRCYVLSTSQGCVVKRLYPDPHDKGMIICHSENTDSFPDYEIPRDEIFGIALVVGHIGAE